MSICNYNNINDLCCNKYSYQYAHTVSDGTRAVAVSGENAAVYRTDQLSGEIVLLNSASNLTIEPCSISDDPDIIMAWECYRIWRNDCLNNPLLPPIDSYRITQKDVIEKAYKARLEQGYSTTVDNIRVSFSLLPEAQVNLASIVLSANILYANDTKSTMPSIYDINGQPITLTYAQIVDLYKKYTNANTLILSLKTLLISQIDAATSIEEIVSYVWDLRLIEKTVACPECYESDDFGDCLPYVGAPYPPRDIVASSLNSGAALSWSYPLCDGGYSVDDYIIEYSLDYGLSWSYISDIQSSGLSTTISGLTNGSTYIFRAAAVNFIGTGNFSFGSNNVTPAAIPTPSSPVSLTGYPGDRSALLTWVIPTGSGGAPITDYLIEYSFDAGSSWLVFDDVVGTGTMSTVTGLSNGSPYVFRVAAINAGGVGAYSNLSNIITPNEIPTITILQQPLNDRVINYNESTTFSINAIVSNNTSPSYQWQAYGEDFDDYQMKWKNISNATGTSLSVSTNSWWNSFGLYPDYYMGSGYALRCLLSASGASSVTSDIVRLVSIGDDYYFDSYLNNANYSYAGSQSVGGSSYDIYNALTSSNNIYYDFYNYGYGNASSWTSGNRSRVELQISSDASTWSTITGSNFAQPNNIYGTAYLSNSFTSDTSRYYRMVLRDLWPYTTTNGSSSTSESTYEQVSGRVRLDWIVPVPTQVTNVTGVAGDASVNIGWTAPSSDRGSAITDYVIQYSVNSGVTWFVYDDAVSSSLSASITGLMNDTTYVFRVAAINAYGTGLFSNSSTGLTTKAATVPDKVSGLLIYPYDQSSYLEWSIPFNNNSAIIDYTIDYSLDYGSSWSTFNDGISTLAYSFVTGLVNGSSYLFRVAAINGVGQGPYSDNVSGIINIAQDTTYNKTRLLLNMDSIYIPQPSYGPTVTFTKNNYGNEVDVIISGTLAITRGDQQGIYNSAVETYYNRSASPANTVWNMDGWSNICSVSTRSFDYWINVVYGNPPGSVGQEMVMKHVPTNRYWLIKFTSWSAGSAGGGFSYERKELLSCS